MKKLHLKGLDFYKESDKYLPDYFCLDIKTYKTYKEWAPYVTYEEGDKVIYYDKLYESTKNNNKLNNPRKYENVLYWQPSSKYKVSDVKLAGDLQQVPENELQEVNNKLGALKKAVAYATEMNRK